MSRTHALIAAITILALTTPASARHNEAHDRLQKLSEKDRRAAFTKYMSDESCGTVTRTFYQGSLDTTGVAFWNAACSNGKSYVIQIEADAQGSSKIMSCALLEAVKGGHCFTKFK